MGLRPGLTLLPLDDEFIAFSEQAQCLVGLNASAALVVRELQRGVLPKELAQTLATQGAAAAEEAEQWVQATLAALGSHGMLVDGTVPPVLTVQREDGDSQAPAQVAGIAPYTPFKPALEQRYRLLDTCALVRFGRLEQVRLVNSVIGHLAVGDSAEPSVIIDLKMSDTQGERHIRTDVYRDQIPIGSAARLSQLAPIVKAALWQSAVNAHDYFFNIHAGVVGTGTSCILLPAAAGSGKSSLTTALVHRGFRYFSDEVALIQPASFHVTPMPLAMGLKSTGWDFMARYYPNIFSLPTHVRSDGKVLRYIPPPGDAVRQTPAPVSHIVFPRYDPDVPTRLQPVGRPAALGRLMDECLILRRWLDTGNVRGLVDWFAGIDCYDLTFSSLDHAVELVAEATSFETSPSFTHF